MAIDPKKIYAASTTYTEESLIGVGALKGAPCTIKSIIKNGNQNVVTFEWTADDGTKRSSVMIVKDGTPIYVWESGKTYSVGDLVVYDLAFYQCNVENSDTEFNPLKWSGIGNAEAKYDIVETSSVLPQGFGKRDRKMYYSIADKCFWLWNGTKWDAQSFKTLFAVAGETLTITN